MELEWIKQNGSFYCDVNERMRLFVKYNANYDDWSWSVWVDGDRVGSWRNKYSTEQQAKGASIKWAFDYGGANE